MILLGYPSNCVRVLLVLSKVIFPFSLVDSALSLRLLINGGVVRNVKNNDTKILFSNNNTVIPCRLDLCG